VAAGVISVDLLEIHTVIGSGYCWWGGLAENWIELAQCVISFTHLSTD